MKNDNYLVVNPVLRKIMKKIYSGRENFQVEYLCNFRVERINNKNFCQLFFLSTGCSHDRKGGCTMCNYGYGKSYCVDYSKVLEEIKFKIQELPDNITEIVVGPIGSMLDAAEVPDSVFKAIIDELSVIKCDEFTCETRIDTISRDKLLLLKNKIKANRITLEIGVESNDLWILRNSINKNITFENVEKTIRKVHELGIQVCANVGVGFPFVNDKICVNSAVSTIKKLIELDVECIVLFAYNIKPGTLLEWLNSKEMYDCSSLWIIPEVLSKFNDTELKRIQISWYRNYHNDSRKILSMPYLCSSCENKVLDLFDAYRNNPGIENLTPIVNYSCECKRNWKEKYCRQKNYIDFNLIESIYIEMSKEFNVSEDEVTKELEYMMNTYERVK